MEGWIDGFMDQWIVGEIILLQSIDPIIDQSITPFFLYGVCFVLKDE